MKWLLPAVPLILPIAAKWVENQETLITKSGRPLTAQQHHDATKAGVLHPESVRLQFVKAIPMPVHPILHTLGRWTGLTSPNTAGITLRYGIYVRQDYRQDRQLLAHELVHVAQYESLGSIEAFLRKYLRECLDPGYPWGPLEQQAIQRAQEIASGE